MPNWTTNIIEMDNITNLPLYTEEDEFDFEKLTPMPAGFNQEVGEMGRAKEDYISALYWYAMKHDVPWPQGKKALLDLLAKLFLAQAGEPDYMRITCQPLSEVQKDCERQHTSMEAMAKIGLEYVKNYQLCGHLTWYDWSIENWGCKWNASQTWKAGDDTVSFQTPWEPPLKVLETLAQKYPDKEFWCVFADEADEGCAGIIYGHDGRIEVHELDTNSKQHKKIYNICWGDNYTVSIKDAVEKLIH